MAFAVAFLKERKMPSAWGAFATAGKLNRDLGHVLAPFLDALARNDDPEVVFREIRKLDESGFWFAPELLDAYLRGEPSPVLSPPRQWHPPLGRPAPAGACSLRVRAKEAARAGNLFGQRAILERMIHAGHTLPCPFRIVVCVFNPTPFCGISGHDWSRFIGQQRDRGALGCWQMLTFMTTVC
jgi:hypothetical protein